MHKQMGNFTGMETIKKKEISGNAKKKRHNIRD